MGVGAEINMKYNEGAVQMKFDKYIRSKFEEGDSEFKLVEDEENVSVSCLHDKDLSMEDE